MEIDYSRCSENISIDLFMQVEAWKRYPKIFHGFGTKRSGGEKRTKKDWYGEALRLEGEEYPIVALKQVHGEEVLIFNGEKPQDLWYREGDAILTQTPGYALAVFTADCLPIMILDPRREAVGIIHAGWRGTSKGIILKAIKKMQNIFQSQVDDIQIAIGPGICAKCLEVDEPVKKEFIRAGIPWEEVALEKEKGKWMLDIYKANFLWIKAGGIKEANIFTLVACPACQNEDYYSYRVEGKKSGRMINFIGLKKSAP